MNSDFFVLLLFVRVSIRPSVCPRFCPCLTSVYLSLNFISPILFCDIFLLSFVLLYRSTTKKSGNICLNLLFTTGLIVTLFTSLMCFLKLKNYPFNVGSLPGVPQNILQMYLIFYSTFGIHDNFYYPPALLLVLTPPDCVSFITPWQLYQKDMAMTYPHLLVFFYLVG